MTQKQLEQLAQVDIRFFTQAYSECPTCHRKFEDMNPLENLVPHFDRTCVEQEKANQSQAAPSR